MDPNSEIEDMLREAEALRDAVDREAREITGRWAGWIERAEFAPSAENLAHYLAFRRHDGRSLQRRLMGYGLSSLGRAEGRVLPTLDAVIHALRGHRHVNRMW